MRAGKEAVVVSQRRLFLEYLSWVFVEITAATSKAELDTGDVGNDEGMVVIL
jgi:hypothetical protein